MRAAYIWNGGSMPLMGKVYTNGDELDPALVDGLMAKKSLLSMGRIKMVSVEGEKTPSAEPVEKTAKKSNTKKTTKKPAKSVSKDTAPEEE